MSNFLSDLEVPLLPIETSQLPNSVRSAVDPNSPLSARLMSAMGVIPTPPEETLLALYQLHFDSDKKVASTATDTVLAMPEALIIPATNKINQPLVLDWIASLHDDHAKIQTSILRNKAVFPKTVARIGLSCAKAVADVVATNQSRMLKHPIILTAIAKNPNTSLTTLNTAVELLSRERVSIDSLVFQEVEARRTASVSSEEDECLDPLEDFVEEKGLPDDVFQEALRMGDKQVEADKLEQEAYDSMDRRSKEALTEVLEEGQERELPAFALLLGMSIAQKMQYLARCGSDALSILVRDPNRLIHNAAVQSPRVRPIDVARWSKDRGLPDTVLGYIASRRDWIRSYEVLHNLVCNPRTPLADSMNLINHVRTNDLKNLQKNKNVSSNIARQAKMLYKKRSGG